MGTSKNAEATLPCLLEHSKEGVAHPVHQAPYAWTFQQVSPLYNQVSHGELLVLSPQVLSGIAVKKLARLFDSLISAAGVSPR